MELDVNKIVTLDFETYYASDYTLSNMPMSEYVLDEQFKVHCVGLRVGMEKAKVYYGFPQIEMALAAIDWSEHDLLAHNCAFDGFILSQRYGHRPRRYFDTLAMARGALGITNSNALGPLAERLGLGAKDSRHLVATKGLVDIPPEIATNLYQYCANDVDLCFDVFVALIGKIPARELELIDLTMKMFCDPFLMIDQERASDQLAREVGRKVAALMRTGVSGEQLMSAPKFADLLKARGINPPQKISPTTGKKTWAFAKTDPGFRALLEHDREEIALLADARLAVRSTIGETRANRLIEAGKDGRRLPVLLQYCGAHTTRWSAGNKMNLQNLPRGGELRKSIIAPPGHKIVVCDSSQIEARLNAWFADETRVLDAFRDWDTIIGYDEKGDPITKGPDVYKLMAADLFHIPVDQVTKDQRQVGKIVVLALGYGMGADKLQFTAANGKPPVKLDSNFCWDAVQTYRQVNANIKHMWHEAGNIIAAMAAGVEGEYKCIKWGAEHIVLPNGLRLHYPNIQADWAGGTGNATYDGRTGKTHIYGGLLIENIIQALARCIVADQMLEISRRYRVVTMTHDEIVCCVPEDQADECFAYMTQVMRTPPSWGPDIPLNSSGGIDVCYSK